MDVTKPTRLLIPALMTLGLAAGLTACDGENSIRITATTTNSDAKGVLKVVDTLKCPDAVGVLTRKGSADPGGGSCTYGGPRGAEVVLYLARLDGKTAPEVLRDYETRLSADIPNANARANVRVADNGSNDASVQAPGVNIQAKGEDATVSLPGLHIETKGDNATVRIGGINIAAKDGQGKRVEAPIVDIDAHGDRTLVRTQAPGEATRMTFVLADDSADTGPWRRVGFEARGPAGGPLVIATVRTKARDEGVFEAAKDLVTQNVGE
jgi:hypothetical protein